MMLENVSRIPTPAALGFLACTKGTKAKINRRLNKFISWGKTRLVYPFERFYLEEHKAPRAEKRYRLATRNSLQTTYAIVRIKNGTTVLEDVLIDGHSIVEE